MAEENWKVGEQYTGGIPIYIGDHHFFTVLAPISGEDFERAHLIAAAPAMLKALKRASELLLEIECRKDASLVENNPEIVNEIEQAIKLASHKL